MGAVRGDGQSFLKRRMDLIGGHLRLHPVVDIVVPLQGHDDVAAAKIHRDVADACLPVQCDHMVGNGVVQADVFGDLVGLEALGIGLAEQTHGAISSGNSVEKLKEPQLDECRYRNRVCIFE